MKNKIDKTFFISTMLCLSPMILTAILYDKLPEQMAVHWNNAGIPDNFASKEFAGFGLPAIMAGINIFTQIMLNNDPKKANYPKVLRFLLKWLIPVMSLILVPVTLFIALGVEINLNVYAPIILGLLFIILGNYLPKTKQNYTMGIKLPWTFNSEENWNKTHRLAGYVWIIGGICIILSSWLNIYSYYASMAILILLVIIPAIYSYLLYRNGI